MCESGWKETTNDARYYWQETAEPSSAPQINIKLTSTEPKAKVVVILSGGMDSAVVCAMAKSMGYEVHALTFDYGQISKPELEAAKKIAAKYADQHHIIDLKSVGSLLSSPLTGKESVASDGVAPTYVPFRNTIMLAIALGYAESIGAKKVYYGANAIDFSGYPDCTPEYIMKFNELVKVAAPGKDMLITSPIEMLSKEDIARLGNALGVDFNDTYSCYAGTEPPCGECESCKLREEALRKAGLK